MTLKKIIFIKKFFAKIEISKSKFFSPQLQWSSPIINWSLDDKVMDFLKKFIAEKLLLMEYFLINELWIPKFKCSSPQSQRLSLFVNQILDDKVTVF